jgi:hypothetical protein
MNTIDWQPIVAAVAVFIGIVAPSIAALVVAIANNMKISLVKAQTDGQLTSLKAEVAVLRVALGETPAPSPTPPAERKTP